MQLSPGAAHFACVPSAMHAHRTRARGLAALVVALIAVGCADPIELGTGEGQPTRPSSGEEASTPRDRDAHATLSVRVLDELFWPIPAFRVHLSERHADGRIGADTWRATTDAEGRARFTGLAPVSYYLDVGGGMSVVSVNSRYLHPLRAGEHRHEIVRLRGVANQLSFLALDPAGNPLPGALINFAPHPEHSNRIASTDESGRFDFGLVLSETIAFRGTAPGLAPISVPDHPVPDRGQPIVLVFDVGRTVRFELIGSDGEPARTANIIVDYLWPGFGGPKVEIPGAIELSHLPKTEFSVVAKTGRRSLRRTCPPGVDRLVIDVRDDTR